VLTWASFTNANPELSDQEGRVETNAYSEKPGDASRDAPARENTAAVLNYSLTNAGGSSFLGAGITVNPPNNTALNLSEYKSLRITLASSATDTVRLRIAGNDQTTLSNGCYPVRYTKVTGNLATYTVAIAEFAAESYCGSNAKSLADTLIDVGTVEIADNAIPNAPRRGKISIARIEFVK
jgi:hypothetical protein